MDSICKRRMLKQLKICDEINMVKDIAQNLTRVGYLTVPPDCNASVLGRHSFYLGFLCLRSVPLISSV